MPYIPVNCIDEFNFLLAMYSATNLTCQSSFTPPLAREYKSTPVGFSTSPGLVSLAFHKNIKKNFVNKDTKNSILILLFLVQFSNIISTCTPL